MATLSFIHSIDTLLEAKGLGFLPALIDIALTLLVAFMLVRTIRLVVRRTLKAARPAEGERAKRFDTAATLAISISKYVVYFIAAAVILGQLGLTASMSSLLTAAGIGGIAVGIGAQSFIKDVVSGLFMLFEDQFAVGDLITAAGVTGTVQAIALRTTTLKSYTGEITVVPNGSITALTNHSRTDARAVVDLPVCFGEDTERALSLMLEEAEAYFEELGPKAKAKPEIAGVIRAENGALTLRVTMLVAPLEHWGVQRELLARCAARFAKEDVAQPSLRPAMAGEERA